MGRSGHACSVLGSLLLVLVSLGSAAAQKGSTWKTLSGDPPAIIAKGGFSGLFPDSSENAYLFATISQDSAVWCDVRLTKDGSGICLPDIQMESCTSISNAFPKGKKTYNVNGVSVTGWFSVDYKDTDLGKVFLRQSVSSRSERYDGGGLLIVPVEAVIAQFKAPAVWLNLQHDSFYSQFNLSMRSYILSLSKQYTVDYISSPEVTILKSLLGRVSKKTKLVFRFLDEGTAEPSTNQTYGSMLKNLTFIKTFASGILVPKHYILPVTADNYLKPHTSVVDDAHTAGLEIYAADFANDFTFSYNYSYDPLAEYLSFIDNGAFSVDGVVTDFPSTPSTAIDCFHNLNGSNRDHGAPLVISHNGASGDYPDCTDLAYQKAVADGADVIDCAVQVTKDGIPICMSSIDLKDVTNVVTSQFASEAVIIKDIKADAGVYTFNLTWEDIAKNLKPTISNPMSKYNTYRNPRNRNAGNFMKLSDFLAFAKDKDLSGIMITVERASFMAEKLGFGVVDAVIKALDDSGYSKQTAQKVMIQSTNSSVLMKFRQQTKYNLVYMIDEDVKDAAPSSLADIKKFADAVSVSAMSIYPAANKFLINQTNPVVKSLQSAGLPVYVYLLMNEFVSQPYDFFSDATAQINAYVQKDGDGGGVDGVITDFPGTAHRYKLNSCKNMGKKTPLFMQPPQRGGLVGTISDPSALPPAMSPMPVLTDSDVAEPPLPPVNNSTAPAPPNAATRMRTDVPILVAVLVLFASLLI
ncbi:glycerophosphodiester phosphodiesterase GDPDL3 [Brachypodium distachyon]|uniref:glycerophosphodiester phosphodiesterase n=1 Tax=Brachypodium distachyon TaxID=15368 RepID=I1IB23_BRADI|nr:glycerophosphodiester phosphodiesterase GDPDL3 [Brachypodium distachyon]KQK00095.1 hypothetical protein BRADI_3g47340v3 [Brachypodium distachyon]|eukprot:XP_024318140.1 glycerophosphodiester phosphodiesterase GDPDL3 [Brachypodium distachyon]